MANERKQKKKGGGWWWIIFLAIALISQGAENVDLRRLWMRFRVSLLRSGLSLETVAPVIAAAVGLIVVIAIIRAAVKRRAEVSDRRPAAARTSAAVQRRDPRAKSFTQPEPYCLVCDHTGEDHFQHDKALRIRQLDEWLKNGLVDREEYKVLKARYERDL